MQSLWSITLLFVMLAVFTNCQQERLAPEALTADQPVDLRKSQAFPDVIPLPDGFQPEGIVAGTGTEFYVGSLADGSIYRGDFRTGEGEIIFTPDGGGVAVGLAFDPRTKYLYVAGGPTGGAYVIDTRTGQLVVTYDFGGAFVNDVIVTRDGAYFTDSFAPVLYQADLAPNGSPTGTFETIPLSGDFTFLPGEFNANGIEATPNGDALIVVNSTTGELYRVDPQTGEATLIDLGGDAVPSGDGLLLEGRTLYVVQNFFNQVAVVELSPDYTSGEVVDVLTDPDFRIPTTITSQGSRLYAVNARFDVAPGPNVEYEVVRVDR